MWKNCPVLITGGASFIGSHLVDALVERGARVRVADDLSSGRVENLKSHLEAKRVELIQGDLRDQPTTRRAVEGIAVVFHLAAAHGGRGYVDLHQAACAENLLLDSLLFQACRQAKVEKTVYASSGCVYPNSLQSDPSQELYLTEEMVGPPYEADNLYGWAKLLGEMSLCAFHKDWGMKSVSCRYFTVYGERGHENHAVIAMIARALIRQDPFVVWGDGTQLRNWTHVSDIVRGTLLAAEKIDDGTALNLGTMERVRVADAVQEVLRLSGHNPKLEFHPEMPTGPMNRVADNALANRLLGWEPRVKFSEGLKRTLEWYFSTHQPDQVRAALEKRLTER